MTRRIRITLAGLAALLLAALAPAAASAAPEPAWKLTAIPVPSNFTPGSDDSYYQAIATNLGTAPTSGPVTFQLTLPPGLTPAGDTPGCPIVAQTVTCTSEASIAPGDWRQFSIVVEVDPGLPAGTLAAEAVVSGGAAATAAAITTPITIAADPLPFAFLAGESGFSMPLTDEDGTASTQAGSHPARLTTDLGFPVEETGLNVYSATEHPREVEADLPPGTIVNPAATPALCTEAQLIQYPNACPPSSQIGTATVLTALPPLQPNPVTSALYNMVPPPGRASSFGFDALGVGIFTHIFGEVRSEDRYQLSAISSDILARGVNPILGVQVQLWGDPSSPVHDPVRGTCQSTPAADLCPVEPGDTPLLTTPTACPGEPNTSQARVRTWEQPDLLREASYESAEPNGAPVTVTGCDQLSFEPALKARPTTNLADSPTGLQAVLQIPQSEAGCEAGPPLSCPLATAHLRKAEVTLPEGLVVNPASANGLAGCSAAQIGLTSAVGENPIRYDAARPSCPDAARIGEVEVDTPLLEHDLPGAVYVATPDDNPFGSLLAIYVVIDDPKSGVVLKLAGHVQADPETGQLTTTFDENPQLPFDEFRLDFFAGPGAALRTPATCGTYRSTSQITPWSAPDSGPPATPSDTYEITTAPGGGECATTPAAQPHAPAFEAGTVSPIAAQHTPFVLHLRREDGSQQFSSLTMKPPPGLVAKLAGTPACADSALAAAAAKSGREERADPSCPTASQVGTVTVGAGAGPAPYYTTGTAYLSGPYKGAPLSIAIITPAAAGPYDLGTVVVRTALQIDSATAAITALADPIPQILQGIPLDVRSIDLALDKPEFTLNPTSCDPMALTGELFSSIGVLAPLHSRFQLAECKRLGFKPKLALQLKGATKRATNPRLIATLTARPGDANIARAQVKLPVAAFLDNSHIKTICTRVQFAADTCPPGSVYGKATATTPLLDYPLTGNVILRSSSNQLPDLVVDLRGPAHQPIRVELAGRTDAVKGALRNTFDLVPDAPVSSFRLELFGGKRGLVELSRNLCRGTYRASVKLDAHNGKAYDSEPKVGNSCKGGKRKGGGRKTGKAGDKSNRSRGPRPVH